MIILPPGIPFALRMYSHRQLALLFIWIHSHW